jgi:hypothetical protein
MSADAAAACERCLCAHAFDKIDASLTNPMSLARAPTTTIRPAKHLPSVLCTLHLQAEQQQTGGPAREQSSWRPALTSAMHRRSSRYAALFAAPLVLP